MGNVEGYSVRSWDWTDYIKTRLKDGDFEYVELATDSDKLGENTKLTNYLYVVLKKLGRPEVTCDQLP